MTSQDELTISIPRLDIPAILEKTILAGIIFILALPLLGDYGTWLFPIGRDIIFKLVTEFLVLLFLVFWTLRHWKFTENCKLKIENLNATIPLALLLFWLIMVLATIFSAQPDFSLWGNIYKNQGLMTWTHYVLFFFLLIGFLNDRKRWQLLINIAIFAATLVGLIALWQVFQNGFDSRAASTLNNSNYLAAYLVLLLPITFAFFLRNKSLFLGSAATIQFLALLSTQTRGGYLGMAAVILIFVLLNLEHKTQISQSTNKAQATKPKTQTAPLRGKLFFVFVSCLPAIALATAGLLIILTPFGQNFQQKLPGFTDRFLSRQNIINGSGPRLEAWRAGWRGILEHPLLGYGPENFFVAFDEHYSGSQDNSGSLAVEGSLWESWFDKAHNFIFDIGATMGFLGLFAYIAIFASAIWVLTRKLSIVNGQLSIVRIGLIAAFSGYLTQNLLGFDTIVPGVYLMFLLGYSHFVTNSAAENSYKKIENSIEDGNWKIVKKEENRNQRNTNFLPLFSKLISIFHFPYQLPFSINYFRILFLCVILTSFVLFAFSFKLHANILNANHQLNLAESLATNVDVEQAFAAFERGLEYNASPINPNLRRRYAVIALAYYDAAKKLCGINGLRSDPASAGSDPDSLSEEKCKWLYDDSKKYLARAVLLQQENAATEWPRFTRNYIYAAQISHILGDYENSDVFFEKALELSPGRISISTEWNRLQNLRKQ